MVAWRGDECASNNAFLFSSFVLSGGNNLVGSIPADFCLLTFLEVIALSHSWEVELPPCTAQLPYVREVYLDGNSHQGRLPDMFHGFPSLEYLNLANNAFAGSIDELFPSSVNTNGAGFTNLRTLLLNNNDLSGEIPQSSLRRLRSLERIEMMGNPKLSGSLNEICKGSLLFAEADCDKVSCRCCQQGISGILIPEFI